MMNIFFVSSLDQAEVDKFNSMKEWWDPFGPFKPLHRMNPKRINYIREFMTTPPSINTQILDVGCGGGLFSESLARLGYRVDAASESIRIAQLHAEQQQEPTLSSRLSYQCTTTDNLTTLENQKDLYDVVCAMEVVEHVAHVPKFVQTCSQLVKVSVKNDPLCCIMCD
jgi:2-polyprenyl-6-hydroxyphenyl methylase/3-demethylubiquinone-9 3-methyltransferase